MPVEWVRGHFPRDAACFQPPTHIQLPDCESTNYRNPCQIRPIHANSIITYSQILASRAQSRACDRHEARRHGRWDIAPILQQLTCRRHHLPLKPLAWRCSRHAICCAPHDSWLWRTVSLAPISHKHGSQAWKRSSDRSCAFTWATAPDTN